MLIGQNFLDIKRHKTDKNTELMCSSLDSFCRTEYRKKKLI